MAELIDETGKEYGKLKVVAKEVIDGRTYWRCECQCGGSLLQRGNILRRGRAVDCGCGKDEYIRKIEARENTASEYDGYLAKERVKAKQTANVKKYPQGYFKDKPCRNCGKVFTPIAPSELYCSDKCIKESKLDKYFTKTYGLSFIEYDSMYKKQGARCAICFGEGFAMQENAAKLVVDHDHETGKVRGLLCHNCNRALGLFQEDAKVVESAVKYLKAAEKLMIKGTNHLT